MSIWTSHGVGRFVAGETDVVLLPRAYRHDGTVPGVVYCHGALGSGLSASDPFARPGEWSLLRGIAERYPVVVADLGGPFTFGNATTVAAIESARRYLQTTWGAKPGKIGLVGVSMGGTGVINYAAAYRANVAAAVGVVPVCDLNELYTGHNGEYAPYIRAAWNLAVGQALPLAANPLNNILKVLGLPYQVWYASNDEAVPVSTVLSLLSLLGLTGTKHNVGALGHTQEAIGAASVPTILQHLATYLG